MAERGTEAELLFGLIALQNNLVSREALVKAVARWLQDKSQPLGELLIEQKALTPEHAEAVRILAQTHLASHPSKLEESLATLSGFSSVAPDDAFTTLPDRGDGDAVAKARYQIVRPHAKGGLGEVLVARDLELNREVALKRIRPRYADDAGSRRRFLLEAEITGALEHPGIVPIYGLGHHADGRPFYAMRFIRGESLQEAAEAFHRRSGEDAGSPLAADAFASLAFHQLLRRFLDVCNAVEYAHSRGVLHRDLKPGNVMLGTYGETLVVDWGLAKATGAAESNAGQGGDGPSLQLSSSSGNAPTQAGAAIGTPAYMPPEQAAGRLDELAPPSDVYSLGATLYHLLAGRAPFENDDAGAVLRKVERGEFTPLARAQPGAPPALAAICQKAMSLRPGERYSSPRALADDVERYLADEPVSAQRQTVAIRGRRWLRRHSRSVAALASILAVGLLSLMAIAVVVAAKNYELAKTNLKLAQATAAEREARRTAETRRQEAESAKKLEQLERERAEAVTDYMVRVFRHADPAIDGREVKVADLLDEAVNRMPNDLGGQPIVLAKLLNAIGQTYRGLGLQREFLAAVEQAYLLFQKNHGEGHADTLAALNNVAAAQLALGDAAKALPLFEKCLKLTETAFGKGHPETLTSLNNLAAAHSELGSGEAAAIYERCLAGRRKVLGDDHPQTLATMSNLAIARQANGENAAALPVFKLFYETMLSKRGEDHPDTLTAMNNLAEAYRTTGETASALPLAERCRQRRRAILGEEHPDTLAALRTVAAVFWSMPDLDAAIPLLEECLEKRRQSLGEEHPDTLVSQSELATAYQSSGDFVKAIPLQEQTLAAKRRKLGADHPSTLTTLNNLAEAFRRSGDAPKAIALFEECLALSREKLGADHPSLEITIDNLARAHLASDRPERAMPLFDELIEARRRRAPGDDLAVAILQSSVANDLLDARQFADGEKQLRESLATLERLRPDHWQTFAAKSRLGAALAGQDRYEEAEPLCLAGYLGLKGGKSELSEQRTREIAFVLERLIDLYERWNKPEEAAKWRALQEEEASPSEREEDGA